MVWDNASSHTAEARAELENAGVAVLPLPTYSSNLNPIERVWSVMKSYFVRDLLYLKGEIAESDVRNLLDTIIERDVNAKVKNIAQGGFRRMLKVLQGKIV
jgi:transposase